MRVDCVVDAHDIDEEICHLCRLQKFTLQAFSSGHFVKKVVVGAIAQMRVSAFLELYLQVGGSALALR